MIHMRQFNDFEENNVKFLVNKQIAYATIQITQTGINKSTLDVTAPVRAFFLEKEIHDFSKQPQGEENKRFIKSYIVTDFALKETKSSIYRPNTKKGDPRMWVYGLKDFVNPDDIFAIFVLNKYFYIINLTRIDIEKSYKSKLINPIQDLINSLNSLVTSVSNELLGLIKEKMSDWVPTTVLADTGVGREVEAQLGIKMNSAKTPDYKGIELKSKRDKAKVRSNLFTKVPNWELSKMKNVGEIVDRYGYIPDDYTHKCMHVTLSTSRPNAQGLGLNVEYVQDWLEANEYTRTPNEEGIYTKLDDVSVWKLMELHESLLTKHKETFWIDVDTRKDCNREYFRVLNIDHTKNPIPSQFDILLEQGKITVDFLLGRDSGGDVFSFKIGRKDRALLFPESETYIINNLP